MSLLELMNTFDLNDPDIETRYVIILREMKRSRVIYQNDPQTLNILEHEFNLFNNDILNIDDPIRNDLYTLYEEVMNHRYIDDHKMSSNTFVQDQRTRRNNWYSRIKEWFD